MGVLEVEAAIRRLIQDLTPRVVLTCDPHGGYYHPDHLAVQRATVMTLAAALVAPTARRRVRATTKRFMSPALACLIVAGIQGRAAEVSRIELLPLETVTATEEQFLLGSQDGRPVTLAMELRLSTATARLPAMILLQGRVGPNRQ